MSGQPQVLGFIWFDVTSMGVTELLGAFAPSTIIPRNQQFTMGCKFKISELFGEGLNNLPPGPGPSVFEYNVTYYAESIGPGTDYKFPPGPSTVTHTIACVKNQYSYDPPLTSVTVAPNSMQAGSYQLSCRVKMSPVAGPAGSAGFPWHVTGFVQGPMIDIYEP